MTMNKNINKSVNYGDRICASIESNGRRLASIDGTDFTSLDSVKRALLQLAGQYMGMAVITVRNCTQGWRDVAAIASVRRHLAPASAIVPSRPRVGAQYLIPWAS